MGSEENKQIKSSPISTSGDGFNFEHSVQAFFVIQMITGGLVPRMSDYRITNIVLQSERYGRNTDDCEITLKNNINSKSGILLVQIKRSFKLGQHDKDFIKTIKDAWKDFNGHNFNKSSDRIMLITGSLDKNGVGLKNMLTYMQSSYSSSDKFWRDYRNKLTGRSKHELEGFTRLINRLKDENDGIIPEDSAIFDFCKSFFIIRSDMHENSFDNGDINLTLIHSILGGKRWKNNVSPQVVWERLHTYITGRNKDQINICIDELPPKLKEIFEEDKVIHRQDVMQSNSDIALAPRLKTSKESIKTSYRKELSLLCLIGGYDSANLNDQDIISKVFGETYATLQEKIQSISNTDNEILKLKDTVWRVIDPKATIEKFSNYIFDNDIDNLKKIYLEVLGEIDPALDLSVDKRHMANIYSKTRSYSQTLRCGVADGMAMIANNQEIFSKCSFGKIDNVRIASVRELLTNSGDTKMWASIADNASSIAQTAPSEFLRIFENTLKITDNNPFIILAEESDGDSFFQKDYMAGFRWALADLAWDKELFSRASIALGELATHEPVRPSGQNYALETILHTVLPWRPQTLASAEVRYRVVEKITKNHRENGRKLLRDLLPNVTQTSIERQAPSWINVLPDDSTNNSVTNKEFWDQSSYYARLFVETANSTDEIIDVIENTNNLTEDSFKCLIDKLNEKLTSMSDDERRTIWDALLREINNLSQHTRAKSSSLYHRTEELQKIANGIEPKNDIEKFSRLFSSYDHELVRNQDWKVGQEEIKQEREAALLNILQLNDIDKLHKFIGLVKFPYMVGDALGCIEYSSLDSKILPIFINDDKTSKEFVRAFIYRRYYYHNQNTAWVSEIGFNDWSDEQKTLFILSLPFKKDTWDLLDLQNKNITKEYWNNVDDFRPIHEEGYSKYAVDNLLKAKRPLASIECIYWSSFVEKDKKYSNKIDNDQCLRALLESINTSEDISNFGRLHHEISKILDYLHKNSDFTKTDLWKVEWAYLSLFSKRDTVQPLALIYLIANDADFFCQLVQTAYKSNKSGAEKPKKIPDQLQNNLLKILSFNDFPIMPGVNQDGKFGKSKFKTWIKKIEERCNASGHLEVAQSIVGGYLINAPKDQTGLWIDKTVAEILDRGNSAEMRSGYNTATHNSRGIHSVDITGSEEAGLRDLWKKRAQEIEAVGFFNFATSLRDLADGFEYERKRVIKRGLSIDE